MFNSGDVGGSGDVVVWGLLGDVGSSGYFGLYELRGIGGVYVYATLRHNATIFSYSTEKDGDSKNNRASKANSTDMLNRKRVDRFSTTLLENADINQNHYPLCLALPI